MLGDPKEARAHAANCMQVAGTASGPTVQRTFIDLTHQWNRLASDLDAAHALLNALNELDRKCASKHQGQQTPRVRGASLSQRRISADCGSL